MNLKYLLLGMTSALGSLGILADSPSKCLTIFKNDATSISVRLSENPKITFALSENFNLENLYSAMVISTESEEIILETLDNYKMVIQETKIAVTDISLNMTNAELKVGESLTLSATVSPEDASNKSVTWTSSDESVATVSSSGDVTAIAAGFTTITASSADGPTASCSVTVVERFIEATGISLSVTNAELKVGESLTLSASVTPEDASDKSVTWSSDNVDVATVDSEGTVTAISIGEATITATCGNVTASCKATVIPTPVESVILNRDELVLKEGDVETLAATVLPDNATDKSVTWTSSDESVATVSSSGDVTAIAAGFTTITASSADGPTASCSVTVVERFIEATGISLSVTNAELKVGESLTLSASVTPEDASDKSVTWSSDNVDVATVDSEGTVTAISIGEATITATCGNVTASCKVTVIPTPVESVILNRDELVLKECDVETLVATVLPDNATDKSVTWTSSDESVATVSSSGDVTAIAAGFTTITATSADGPSASCAVTVDAKFTDVKENISSDNVNVIGREIIIDSKIPNLSYSIYTTNGLIMESGTLPSGRSSIDLSTYSSGTYIAMINNQKIKFIIK